MPAHTSAKNVLPAAAQAMNSSRPAARPLLKKNFWTFAGANFWHMPAARRKVHNGSFVAGGVTLTNNSPGTAGSAYELTSHIELSLQPLHLARAKPNKHQL
jgi:hypothetical protein